MASRAHVLFLIPSLRGGGAERVIVTLLRYLDRSKFTLTLAVLDMRGAVYRNDVPNDVEVLDLQCTRVRYALPKLMRLIWQRRPEVVFSTLGHLNLALAIIRRFLPNDVRYVARETSIVSETLRGYSYAGAWRWAYRYFCARFDFIVCQSEHMRRDLVDHFGIRPSRTGIIHNPVDLALLQALAEAPIPANASWSNRTSAGTLHLVAAGRLSNEKGFDLLIESIAMADDRNIRLTILGDGPMRETLERHAHEMGVANQVKFVGFRKNPYPFFAQADALVLSSRHEGFPNVVLEALACGTPVIATPAPGGIAEIAALTGGVILASAVSAEALASELQRFARSRSRPTAITIDAFLVERIVTQYQEMLTEEASAAAIGNAGLCGTDAKC